MIKIVSTKEWNRVTQAVEESNALHESALISMEKLKHAYDILKEERDALKEQLERVESEESSVTMKFSVDATNVVPVVKYNPALAEKLIELGYLNDATAQDKFAVQITMMTLAAEAIDQILESFSADIKED